MDKSAPRDFWRDRLGPLVDRIQAQRAAKPDSYQHRPKDLSYEAVQQWIVRQCELLDVTPSAVALKAELAASTLTRFLGKGKKSMTADTIQRIGVAFARLAAEAKPGALIFKIIDEEAKRLRIPVVGVAAPGVFAERPLFNEPWQTIEIPSPRSIEASFKVGNEQLFAFENPPNDWILVSPLFLGELSHRPPADGDHVLCHFRRGNDIETIDGTYKISPTSDGWLVASSTDRAQDRYLGKAMEAQDFFVSSKVIGRVSLL
ncbi:hypothetical protein [Bradyrhizobium neotropicale]|uniref:hypothetical protein n=1 Tax=Bradyrhizobium neotropicale TaxID=1497615 RepID=UPI001AD6AF6F|nr:hypothetical protein [Bradyrhizobium neotropicale]MBO4227227.1 hypothetical protein [Bradyrhizobium neotropicale]